MNHRYIDESSMAERYLEHSLALEEKTAFEAHLVGCEECADRVLLAQIFLDKSASRSRRETGSGNSFERRNGAAGGPKTLSSESLGVSPAVLPASVLTPDTLPWTARFVAQFRPWQLALILITAAALLLLAPTAYCFWELAKLRHLQ